MRKLVVLLVVATLVTTAGCSLFDSGDEREPDAIDEGGDLELLPGLTTDGVTDRTALAATHYEALENESYRLESWSTVRNESGSILADREETQVVADDASEVLLESDQVANGASNSSLVTAHSWSDGDAEYTRIVDASGDVTYLPEAQFGTSQPGPPVSIHTLFDAVDAVSVDRSGGTERYRLEGADDAPSASIVSFELFFSEDGFVEEYRIESRFQNGGDTQYVEHVGSIEVEDDGWYFERNHVGYYEERTDIELEEPDWLEEAKTELEDR